MLSRQDMPGQRGFSGYTPLSDVNEFGFGPSNTDLQQRHNASWATAGRPATIQCLQQSSTYRADGISNMRARQQQGYTSSFAPVPPASTRFDHGFGPQFDLPEATPAARSAQRSREKGESRVAFELERLRLQQQQARIQAHQGNYGSAPHEVIHGVPFDSSAHQYGGHPQMQQQQAAVAGQQQVQLLVDAKAPSQVFTSGCFNELHRRAWKLLSSATSRIVAVGGSGVIGCDEGVQSAAEASSLPLWTGRLPGDLLLPASKAVAITDSRPLLSKLPLHDQLDESSTSQPTSAAVTPVMKGRAGRPASSSDASSSSILAASVGSAAPAAAGVDVTCLPGCHDAACSCGGGDGQSVGCPHDPTAVSPSTPSGSASQSRRPSQGSATSAGECSGPGSVSQPLQLGAPQLEGSFMFVTLSGQEIEFTATAVNAGKSSSVFALPLQADGTVDVYGTA